MEKLIKEIKYLEEKYKIYEDDNVFEIYDALYLLKVLKEVDYETLLKVLMSTKALKQTPLDALYLIANFDLLLNEHESIFKELKGIR